VYSAWTTSKHESEVKNRIGFVYDENHYYEELTARGQMKRSLWHQPTISGMKKSLQSLH
jgi:ABC-type multidrug transport system ATPase subunit